MREAAAGHYTWARRHYTLVYNLGAARDPELFGRAHEVDDRFRPHLAHDLTAVHLYGDHAQAELGGDLLVQPPGDYPPEDFALPLRERAVARLRIGEPGRLAASLPIALDRGVHGIEQRLLVEGLGEELHGARLHGAHRHRNVAVPGDEDDRQR